MQPAAHGLARNRDATPSLQFQSDRRATPAGAAPPTGPGYGLQDGQHGALEARRQRPRPPWAALPVWLLPLCQLLPLPGPVRPDHTIDRGARTEQHGGNLGRAPSSGAQEKNMQSQQVAVPGTAHLGQHAGLLGRANIHYRRSWHQRTSLINQVVSQLLIYQQVLLCANLLWFDLAIACFVWYDTGHRGHKGIRVVLQRAGAPKAPSSGRDVVQRISA